MTKPKLEEVKAIRAITGGRFGSRDAGEAFSVSASDAAYLATLGLVERAKGASEAEAPQG